MKSFLITFPSATLAFRAEKEMKSGGIDDAKVEAVPTALSGTCYGLGVAFSGEEPSRAIDICNAHEIQWKRCWLRDGDKFDEMEVVL